MACVLHRWQAVGIALNFPCRRKRIWTSSEVQIRFIFERFEAPRRADDVGATQLEQRNYHEANDN